MRQSQVRESAANNRFHMISRINAKKVQRVVGLGIYHICLICISIVFLFPVLFMITKSLMTNLEAESLPIRFFPSKISFESYELLLRGNYLKYLKNTAVIVIANIIGVPLSASLCAYSFAKISYKGREFVFGAVLATMMLPGVVTQIPVYVLFSQFGWLNTPYPLIVPSFLGGGALNIFLLRQFMRGIPNEL